MLQKCEGIVIRIIDYGETNKIITLYTREWGKIGVMARGAKKPNSEFGAITQYFTHGYFVIYRGRGLGTLQQGELITAYRPIREDIYLTAYASYLIELTDKSTEEQKPNPFLFELLQQSLQYMADGYDAEILKNIFEIKILALLGIHPGLDVCVYCGDEDGPYGFSIRGGGFICRQCFDKDPYHLNISEATGQLLRLFYYFDLSRLGSISVKKETKAELKRVIDYYYEEYSGLYLKSKRFLDQMERLNDQI